MASGGSSSTRTPPGSWSAARDRSDNRGEPTSCYFPGCRKDTNCHCDICLASINATLDLLPQFSHGSRTKLSSPAVPRQLSSDPPKTFPCTPEITRFVAPPPPETSMVQSTAKSRPREEGAVEKKASREVGGKILVGLLLLGLVLAVDNGVPKAMISRGFGPKLTAEAVRQAGEDSRVFPGDLKKRIELLQQRVERLVGEKVFDCSLLGSGWEFYQGGQSFFHWKCVIYRSMVEEVSVWGSPLRSSGLLPVVLSHRSLTVLNGRIMEWSDGRLMFITRTSNSSSWTSKKWSKAALQLDKDTWVLEYRRSVLMQDQWLLRAAWEMMQCRASEIARRFKHEPWRLIRVQTSPSLYKQDPQETRFPT